MEGRGRLEGLAREELATKTTAGGPTNLGFTLSTHHSHSSHSKQMLSAHEIGKVMSLLLNMLSRLVITFLPRSKRLFISWLQSPSVILEPHKIKSDTVCTVSPSISHEVMGPDAMMFVF